MESRFKSPVNGVSIERGDFDTIAENAASADDRVLAELLRLAPYDGTTDIARGVLPWGLARKPSLFAQSFPLVAPSSMANGSIVVWPFRAVIGTRTGSGTPDKWLYKDVQSGMFLPAGGNGQLIQIPATVANSRWDTIYARIDLDSPSAAQPRYVKGADHVKGTAAYSCYTSCKVSVLRQEGVESATPGMIAPAADTATTKRIVLGYVRVDHPHTLTSTIAPKQILEAAPILGLSSGLGGSDCRPASLFSSVDYAALLGWASGPATARPQSLLPETMSGKVERFFGLDFTGGQNPIPANTSTVIDSSIDWRRRLFRTSIQGCASSGAGLAWKASTVVASASGLGSGNQPVPGVDNGFNPVIWQFGQSMSNDDVNTTAGMANPFGVVASVGNSQLSPITSPASVRLYVDTSGNLCAYRNSSSPNCLLFFWLEATAPFLNSW